MTHRLDGGFFRSAIESSRDSVTVLDPEGCFLYMNRAGLAGFEIDDFTPFRGLPCAPLWPEPGRSELIKGWALARDGQSHQFEGECATVHGAMRWWDVTISPVCAADGRMAGMISTARDITDVRLAQLEADARARELARSEAALRLAFRTANLGGWEVDAESQITTFSPELCKLFGSPTLPPIPFAAAIAFWIEEDRVRFRDILERAIRDATRFEFEGRAAGADGVFRSYRMVAEPELLEGRCVRMRGVTQDITEWRDVLERERLALQAADAMSGFLATMSHEIRTPLNGVLGLAQAMALDELNPAQRDRLKVIEVSGVTLLRLLDDLLDLSKMEAGKIQLESGVFDLGEIAEGAQALFAALTQDKDVALHLTLDASAQGHWLGDPNRVRQVLHNLVSNAVKFTDYGSVVVDICHDGQAVVLSVRDTGIGIAPESLAYVFDKFVQVDASMTRRYGGSGLGLTITRDLVELMGGNIQVASIEGVGTTFTVHLPLDRATSPGPEQVVEPPAHEATTDPKLRVLAAEDNPTNQLVLKTLLGSFGVEPVIVGNGREAVDAWLEEPWDIILMDIQMPLMDGIAATRLIRETERIEGRAHTPIIAVTANVMANQKAEYLAAGLDATVAKPVNLAALLQTMEAALNAAPAPPGQMTG
jgi:PAS domain S-box-containing protein